MFSGRFVLGFPEQRLAYLAEKISEVRADFCVVLAAQTQRFMGLLRIADAATQEGAHNRILCDLLSHDVTARVRSDSPAEAIEPLLAKSASGALAVIDKDEMFVGLITKESHVEWQLSSRARKSDKSASCIARSDATVISFEQPAAQNEIVRDA